MLNLLRRFLSNFIKPELLAATTNEELHNFDYATLRNQVSNDELGIGTAARLHLIDMSDKLEGTQREELLPCCEAILCGVCTKDCGEVSTDTLS